MIVRIGRIDDVVEHLAIGLVLALAFLVLHHTALLIEPMLVHRPEQIAHAIRLKPQNRVERIRRHSLEVVGAIRVGRTILVGRADLLRRLEEVVVEVLRAIEHQMLEQVREARPALGLVL